MKRHLFKRTIKKKGKNNTPVKAWYYWYIDPKTGKQVRKSCGTSKKPVLIKSEAEAIIDKLEQQDREYLAMRAEVESVTIKKMADSMFRESSEYVKRRKEQGYIKNENALKTIKGYLDGFIIEKYGHLKPEELDPVVVNNDLINMERSNSWRNSVVSILNNILDEAIWLKMIKYKPVLLTYKRAKGKKSILSQKEMATLFPSDFDELSRIWSMNWAKNKNTMIEGFMFGTLFALMTSTGLRSGEVRAIHPSQLIVTDGKNITRMVGEDGREKPEPFGKTKRKIAYGLLVDRMYNSVDKVVMHLKKGSEENPNLRSVVIPEKTVKYLKHWLEIRPSEPQDLLFAYQGRYKKYRTRIRKEYLEYRLSIAIANAELDMSNDRHLTPHSLRFTYNTKMKRKVSGDKLRLMIGHGNKEMTDYYTVNDLIDVEEQFIELSDDRRAIDNFWG